MHRRSKLGYRYTHMVYKKIVTSSVMPRKNDNLIVGTYFFQISPTFSKSCLIKGIKWPCWCRYLWTLSHIIRLWSSSLDTSHPLSTCERLLQGRNTTHHIYRQDKTSRELVSQPLNTNDPSLEDGQIAFSELLVLVKSNMGRRNWLGQLIISCLSSLYHDVSF